MIDSPPAEVPAPEVMPPERRGVHIGGRRITPGVVAGILVAIAMIGSAGYIVYVITQVEDEQINLLGYGFAVLGASFVAIAIGCVVAIWRAAMRARVGRAFALAIVGGIAGLIAIACFAFTAIAAMLGVS